MTVSAFSLTAIVVVAATAAFVAAHILRRIGAVNSNPVRYLPHFVFLLVVALSPMIAAERSTFARAKALLAVVVVIWLVAVLASDYLKRKSPGKSR